MQLTTQMNIYQSLNKLMQLNSENFNAESKAELESLYSYCREGMDRDSQKFLVTLLLNALNKRLSADSLNENIYEKKYEVSQIQLFNILIDKFPYVKYSQQIINNAIVDIIRQHSELTIIDIGVGLGTQMVNVIEKCKNLPHLKKLVIVGIEPFEDALKVAEERVKDYREKVLFDVEFVALKEYIEKVDFSTIEKVSGKVIVNASLALHHIQTQEQRNHVIAGVRKLSPAAFILTEPNVNHFEPDFYARFKNCYNHFYSLFCVIDKLEISEDEKNGLKLFFGREIEDILGKSESERFEKHEPATGWIEKLKANHFMINTHRLPAPPEKPCDVEIKHHPEGFLGFTYNNETALSVIYAN